MARGSALTLEASNSDRTSPTFSTPPVRDGPLAGQDSPERYPPGFEEDDRLRSDFIRELTLRQLCDRRTARPLLDDEHASIPQTLVRYWHDPSDLPSDVGDCLASWEPLREEGFRFRLFDDRSAAGYIAGRYGRRECEAFSRCRHPAMRSDYLRMCFLLAEGGLYVDADDVLLGGGCSALLSDSKLKIHALCYDVPAGQMLPSVELRRLDLPMDGRIFYVNNNPIAAPAGHPVLRRALARATAQLLGGKPSPEIQSTTGPGNLSAVLAAHARARGIDGMPDFEFLFEWTSTAEPRWNLSYRNDERNWRNMTPR